jgi:hypothetical protein
MGRLRPALGALAAALALAATVPAAGAGAHLSGGCRVLQPAIRAGWFRSCC